MQTIRSWWSDRLLRNVLTNSSYLFSSNAAMLVTRCLDGAAWYRDIMHTDAGTTTHFIHFTTQLMFICLESFLSSKQNDHITV